ncbi:hypothetical protein [Brevibacterium casei]|uniref:Uncharacterized protein n=2 Tax=Brevibacterium casei TaxID=33889 RepID=K9B405_9MICO|nr:hypothetical protein [Brevibacterium casei]EKU49547.1 hypothetical protein C272_02390 [Brevibacterium casei S18]MCT1551421.1 hypothetical protein [Brevibacterium casei]MCT1560864.1 hypothetical protein [Brevibacterium casei]MCT2209205.1 hypothetical protein [Brevibacterium casei]PAK96024.1 hypothetical protein B8X04_07155 [Brevibacterium casei]
MAEEQFTSRRARREAERLAAEQEFEARSTPAQPTETNRADLLTPPERPVEKPKAPAEAVQDSASRIDPAPAEKVAHERGALASDHLPQERPPVNAADRLDPRRAPLPHFESRAERKRYLREYGLSLDGDLSTGAIPVIAEPEESQPDADARPVEHESFDTAGFGGTSDEVAARDFESPVTPDSAPRPAAPEDAPARPTGSAPAEYTVAKPADAPGKGTMPNREESKAPDVKAEKTPAPGEKPAAQTDATPNTPAIKQAGTSAAAEKPAARAGTDAESAAPATPAKTADREATTRSRRMPIVQPPATKGVRVVTAASAQVSETTTETGARETEITETEVVETATASPTSTPRTGTTSPTDGAETAKKDERAGDEAESAQSADDAARALAANPETRPMDAVPEAWALPNADYEDEETENPPGHRIKASAVTGHDGQILVGEEPSKVPFIVLGVAALFAVALIVIALVMLL